MKKILTIAALLMFSVATLWAQTGPRVLVTYVDNVAENGKSTGKITLSITEGTSPYTTAYKLQSASDWTTVLGTEISGLAAGTYEIKVTDNASATTTITQVVTQAQSVTLGAATIDQPDQLVGSTGTVTNVACHGGATGVIPVTVSDGTAPYTVTWEETITEVTGSITIETDGATENITGLPAGTYTIAVADANGCTNLTSDIPAVTITEPLDLNPGAINTLVAFCSGETGKIIGSTSAASEGVAPEDYIYTWEKSTSSTFATIDAVEGTATGLTYELTGTELVNETAEPVTTYYRRKVVADGCTGVVNEKYSNIVAVTVNPLPVGTINPIAANALCATGSEDKTTIALAYTSTGSAPTTWAWTVSTGSLNDAAFAAPTFTTAAAGTSNINLTVTDANSCSYTAPQVTATINELPTVSLGDDFSICYENDVVLTATPSDGTSPYTYKWNDDASYIASNTFEVSDLATTTGYKVKVKDYNGCSSSAYDEITVTVDATPSITLTASPNDLCLGSTTTLATTETDGTFTWTAVTNPTTAGLGTSTSNTVNATPTAAAEYQYKVERTVGASDGGLGTCANTAIVMVRVNENPSVVITNNDNVAICADGPANKNETITLEVTEVAGDTYAWTPATGLNATIGTTVTANPTATETYEVEGTRVYAATTLYDGVICTATDNVIVNVQANPIVSVDQDAIATCSNVESATVTATGADTYQWVPTSGVSDDDAAAVTFTLENATELNADHAYTVTGTKAYNIIEGVNISCANKASTTVTVYPLPSVTLAVTPTEADICLGQETAEITATASGSTHSSPSYTYTWTGAAIEGTGSVVNANPTATGNYSVIVTDNNGCVSPASESLEIVVNALPTFTTTAVAAECYGHIDGTHAGEIEVSDITGATDYNITWTGTESDATSLTVSTTAATIAELQPGTYAVKVVDGNGCSTEKTDITIDAAADLVPGVVSAGQFVCYNNAPVPFTEAYAPANNQGEVTHQWQASTNGTDWTNVGTDNGFAPGALTATTQYKRIDTDPTCNITKETNVLTVNVNPEFTYTLTNGDAINCFGGSDGSLKVNITSGKEGTSAYSVYHKLATESAWRTAITGSTSPISIPNLSVGDYDIQVLDSKGCAAEAVTE